MLTQGIPVKGLDGGGGLASSHKGSGVRAQKHHCFRGVSWLSKGAWSLCVAPGPSKTPKLDFECYTLAPKTPKKEDGEFVFQVIIC